MYYRLKDNYILRGWDRLPYAIADTKTGNVTFLRAEEFNAIDLCNGKIDLSLPQISEDTRSIVRSAEKIGIIEECSAGHGLNPNQEYRLYPARYINKAHWSITGKCNFRCRHCFLSAPDALHGELPHDVIMNIINQLGECGVMNVALTGGEPLIRSDFLEIVDALLERNIRITHIYSNGALVNERLLDELSDRGVYPEFNMSYDGVGWHDWLRGIDGAEKMIDRAFELCRERGFPTGAEMCIHQFNKHTLRESIKHMASLGVKSVKTNPVSNSGEWLKNGYGESMSLPELFQYYLDYIPMYYEDNMPMQIMLSGFFMADPERPDVFHIPVYKPECDPETFCMCGHARMVMYISPEGRVLPCMSLSGRKIEEKFPMITKEGLSECITDSYYMKIINMRASEFLALHEECRECKYSSCCYGGCRADALAVDENDLTGKSPASCMIFRGGWVDKIIETVRKVRPNAKSPVMNNPLWKS